MKSSESTPNNGGKNNGTNGDESGWGALANNKSFEETQRILKANGVAGEPGSSDSLIVKAILENQNANNTPKPAPAEPAPTTPTVPKPGEVNYDSEQGTGGAMADAVFGRLVGDAQQDQQSAAKPSDDDLAAYNRWQDERSGKSNNGDGYVHGQGSGPTFADMDFSRPRNVRDKVIKDKEGKVIGIDKDGSKTRSYTDWDIYNRQKGETNEEFGERTRSHHESERQYQEREKLIQQAMRAYYEGKYDRKARDERIKRIMEMSLKPKKDSHEVTDNEHDDDKNNPPVSPEDDKNPVTVGEITTRFIDPVPPPVPPVIEVTVDKDPDNDPDTNNPDNSEKPDSAPPEDPEIKNIVKVFGEEKEKRRKELEGKLAELRPELAELYARNRRLIVGSRNRIAFEDARIEYRRMLDEYLKLQAEKTNAEERNKVKPAEEDAKKAKDEANAKLEEFKKNHPNATAEEIDAEKQRLQIEATNKLFDLDGVKTRTSAKFLSEYLKQQNALEVATTEAIDNGTSWRRLVHSVIDNKYVKTGLAVIGAAGLVASGAAIIAGAGALTVGLGWTAGGVALGAGRGALSATILSRRDSKNSAVRRLMSEEESIQAVERISVSENGNADVANVAGFLMERYKEAKSVDHSSNVKRTAISAGIGAILGGVLSGVQINKTVTGETTEEGIVGYEPGRTETHSTIDINSISHARGKGTEKLFLEMGGESSESYYSSNAHQIVLDVGKRWGLTEGKSGWTFPGKISEWPTQAQGFAREVSEEWARQGLIPSTTIFTPGEAIYGPITTATTEIVRDGLFENIIQGISTVGAGLFGSTFGNLGRNRRPLRSQYEAPNRTAEQNIDDLFRTPGDDGVGQPAETAPAETGDNAAEAPETSDNAPEAPEVPPVETESSDNASEEDRVAVTAQKLDNFAVEQGFDEEARIIFNQLSSELGAYSEQFNQRALQLLNSMSDEQLDAMLTFFTSGENANAFSDSAFYNWLKTTSYGAAL